MKRPPSQAQKRALAHLDDGRWKTAYEVGEHPLTLLGLVKRGEAENRVEEIMVKRTVYRRKETPG